jgi:hypothetical protein
LQWFPQFRDRYKSAKADTTALGDVLALLASQNRWDIVEHSGQRRSLPAVAYAFAGPLNQAHGLSLPQDTAKPSFSQADWYITISCFHCSNSKAMGTTL